MDLKDSFGSGGRIRMHWFSLAGGGKTNKGIRQRLRWLMHMPYGMCDDTFDSPKRQKRRDPKGARLFWSG